MAAAPEVIAAARHLSGLGYNLVAVKADKRPWGKDWRRIHPLDEVLALLEGPNSPCVAIGFLGGEFNRSIVALDFDNFKGEAWFRESCKAVGLDPFGWPVVITPGKVRPDGMRFKGRHRYMLDNRALLGNSAGALAQIGIDVRGRGHTMLPPSPHPDGGLYEWMEGHSFDDFPLGIPPVPDWVYDAILAPAEPAMAQNPDIPEYRAPFIEPPIHAKSNGPDAAPGWAAEAERRRIEAYCRAALAGARTRLAAATKPGRNIALNNEALGLGHLAHLGVWQANEVLTQLMAACTDNGLVNDKGGAPACHATFWSGWNKGLSEPRELQDRPLEGRQGADAPPPMPPHDRMDGRRQGEGFDPDTGEVPPQDETDLSFTLADWAKRDIPPADFLLGDLFSTTSRVIIGGPTGLGKTQLALIMAFAMASGLPFLHWGARRPARVLYLDGEMSRRLALARIMSAIDRFGYAPDGLVFINKEDFETMPPLNSEEGQAFVDHLIDRYGPFDFIVIDNIQSWCPGDLKSPESWAVVLPWIRALTKRSIGQLWIHHTGHETDRLYGDKSREWQLDTVGLMSKPDSSPEDRLIDFSLEFSKARERTPANRSDFDPVNLWMTEDDGWQSDRGQGLRASSPRRAAKPVRPQALDEKFYEALIRALDTAQAETTESGSKSITIDNWKAACEEMGLLDKARPHSYRTMFSKHKVRLIALEWILVSGDFVTAIRER